MKIEFSWRYGVMGIYRDRDRRPIGRGRWSAVTWRVYPCPFVRISFDTHQ